MGDTTATAKSFFEHWNERNFDPSLATDDAEFHEVASNELYQGPDGLKEEYEKWAGAFPDGQIEFLNTISSGDSVVIESRFHGTNTGPFGDMEPTGRSLTFDFCSIVNVRGEQIAGIRHYHDNGTIMQQLGLMPAEVGAS
jgi:predicted ester cyclase